MYTHPTAIVEEKVTLGNGTYVWSHTHIMEGARLGVSCNVGNNVFIGRKVIIGDKVKICNGANIPEGVIIKDNVFIGSNVSFKNVKYPRAYRKANGYLPTVVEENATIDANACLMPGIVIGKNSTVGAGAIVIKDVSEGGFVVSPPAECICERDTCAECQRRKQKKLKRRLKYAKD
ncbi:hypothetical protein LCGC14_1222200 [marine sediment metagenome]|uniref:UDP-3-O-[3-hydroxymyristoyl] glucosamine N-acyltransferase non-repeat region domain-containing protein n=1 Tax=marine sediment metagenome TaxID=412755 RepID=A0A0F9LEY3_9ZZZZ|nr:N-acetyltransferase [Candidatus Scalindua sp.]